MPLCEYCKNGIYEFMTWHEQINILQCGFNSWNMKKSSTVSGLCNCGLAFKLLLVINKCKCATF